MTFTALDDFLTGYAAAENGEVFDFRKSKDWQHGHMRWTEEFLNALSLLPKKEQSR